MKNIMHFGTGSVSRFLYRNVEFDKSKLGGKAEWARDQLKNETADELGNLVEKGELSKDEVVKLLSKPEVQVNWSKKENLPENSARYVLALQAALKILGHEEFGTLDALFGPKTRESVLSFQKKWNADHPNDQIKVDGWPGVETLPRVISTLKGVVYVPEGKNTAAETMSTQLDSFVTDNSVIQVEIQDNTGREDTFIVEDKNVDTKENKAVKVPKSLKVTFKDSGKFFYYAISPDAKSLYWFNNDQKRYEPESTLKIENGKIVIPEKKKEENIKSLDSAATIKLATDSLPDLSKSGKVTKIETLAGAKSEYTIENATPLQKIDVTSTIRITFAGGDKTHEYVILEDGKTLYWIQDKAKKILRPESYFKIENGKIVVLEKKEEKAETTSTNLKRFETANIKVFANTKENADKELVENGKPRKINVPEYLEITFESGKKYDYTVSEDGKTMYWFNPKEGKYYPESTLKIENGKIVIPEVVPQIKKVEKGKVETMGANLKQFETTNIKILTNEGNDRIKGLVEQDGTLRTIHVPEYLEITFENNKTHFYTVSEDGKNLYWYNPEDQRYHTESTLKIENGKIIIPKTPIIKKNQPVVSPEKNKNVDLRYEQSKEDEYKKILTDYIVAKDFNFNGVRGGEKESRKAFVDEVLKEAKNKNVRPPLTNDELNKMFSKIANKKKGIDFGYKYTSHKNNENVLNQVRAFLN